MLSSWCCTPSREETIDPQLQRDLRIIVEVTSPDPQLLSTSVNFWHIVSHELGPEHVVGNSKTFGGALADDKPSTLEYHLWHSQLQYSSNYDLSARVLQGGQVVCCYTYNGLGCNLRDVSPCRLGVTRRSTTT